MLDGARRISERRPIRWNQTFRDILETRPDGSLHIDYGKFHEVEPLAPGKPLMTAGASAMTIAAA